MNALTHVIDTCRRILSIAVLAGIFPLGAAAAEKPTTIKICHQNEDVFPWNFKDKPGLSMILMKTVEQKTGYKFEFSAAPWKRCQEEIKTGAFDAIFFPSFSKARMEIGVFPMAGDNPHPSLGVMHYDGYHFYRLKGSNAAQWDGKTLTAHGSISAQPGYSIIAKLQALGAKIDDGAKACDDNLRKVLAGRVDAAALQTLEADHSLKNNPEFSAKIEKVLPPLEEKPFYLMFSKQFHGKYGDAAATIWKSVEEVRESAEYKAKVASFK